MPWGRCAGLDQFALDLSTWPYGNGLGADQFGKQWVTEG